MRRTRSALFSFGLLSAVAALLFATGCVAPGSSPEDEILHEPTVVFEPKIGIFAPGESDLDNGLSQGLKASYEYAKNAYVSLDFGYVTVDGSDNDFVNDPTIQAFELRDLGAETLSEANRITALISWDFDIPIWEGEYAPYFRAGIGVGALFILAEIDDSLAQTFMASLPSLEAEADDRALFLIRPSVGLRFPLIPEKLALFAEGYYDYASGHQAIDLNGDNISTDEIDFGGFGGMIGLSLKFK